jgi:hypothetical protein
METNHRAIMSTPPSSDPLMANFWLPLENRTLLVFQADGSTQFEDIGSLLPSHFQSQPRHPQPVAKCYPNPFNQQVQIEIDFLPAGVYELNIYDVKGIRIHRTSHTLSGNKNIFRWSGRDDDNRNLVSGQYLYVLRGETLQLSGKLILLK